MNHLKLRNDGGLIQKPPITSGGRDCESRSILVRGPAGKLANANTIA